MPKTKPQRAKKGSQFWLQELVNNPKHSREFSAGMQEQVGLRAQLEWLSPKVEDGYAEYRDRAFLERLGLDHLSDSLKGFWPARGPRWDGLAKSGRNCLLIEAKAHVSESISTNKASPKSREKIDKAFKKTISAIGGNPALRFQWHNGLYQMANRIAHLHFLRDEHKAPAHLIVLNFTNDATHISTTEDEFKGALTLAEQLLGLGRHRLRRYVHHAYFDVGELKT